MRQAGFRSLASNSEGGGGRDRIKSGMQSIGKIEGGQHRQGDAGNIQDNITAPTKDSLTRVNFETLEILI